MIADFKWTMSFFDATGKERLGMELYQIIVTAVQVLLGVVLTTVVLMQSGKSAGLSGAIAGGADTFFSKNKAKTWDSTLAKWTKYIAIAFMVLTLVITIVI